MNKNTFFLKVNRIFVLSPSLFYFFCVFSGIIFKGYLIKVRVHETTPKI